MAVLNQQFGSIQVTGGSSSNTNLPDHERPAAFGVVLEGAFTGKFDTAGAIITASRSPTET
jgi:hypothetical protein